MFAQIMTVVWCALAAISIGYSARMLLNDWLCQ